MFIRELHVHVVVLLLCTWNELLFLINIPHDDFFMFARFLINPVLRFQGVQLKSG